MIFQNYLRSKRRYILALVTQQVKNFRFRFVIFNNKNIEIKSKIKSFRVMTVFIIVLYRLKSF